MDLLDSGPLHEKRPLYVRLPGSAYAASGSPPSVYIK